MDLFLVSISSRHSLSLIIICYYLDLSSIFNYFLDSTMQRLFFSSTMMSRTHAHRACAWQLQSTPRPNSDIEISGVAGPHRGRTSPVPNSQSRLRIDVPGLPSFISDSVLDLRVPLCGTGRRPCRARPRAHVRANKARSRASRCRYSRARGRRPSPSARGTWPERAGRRAALLGTPKGHMSLRVAAAVHPTPKFRNRTILRGGTSPRHDDARPTLPPPGAKQPIKVAH